MTGGQWQRMRLCPMATFLRRNLDHLAARSKGRVTFCASARIPIC